MEESAKKCLIISVSEDTEKRIGKYFSESGIEASFINDVNNLYSVMKRGFNVAVLNADYNKKSAVYELIENVKICSPETPIIALSRAKDFELARGLVKTGVYAILDMPLLKKELLETVGGAIQENIDRINKSRLLKIAQQRPYDILLLKEIAEATAKAKLNINYLLQKIIERVAALLNVKTVSIMMLDEKLGALKMSAYMGLHDAKAKRAKIKLGERIAGFVAKTGEPLLINNIQSNPAFSQSAWARSTYNTSSLLTVPIKLKDEVIGIINVNNKEDGSEFNESDKNMLITISNQVGMAIENFRLYAKVKDKAGQLEKTNKKLKALSKAKSELLCNLSHELKTPLTSVIGYLELLINFSVGESEETKSNYINTAHTESLKLAQLIERILNFFNLDTNKIEWDMAEIKLHDVLGDIIKQMQPAMSDEKITFEYQNDLKEARMFADCKMLKRAFEQLFENAIKFNDKRRRITLKVEKEHEGNCSVAKITLFNTGKKIKKEHLEKIFEDFYQPGNILTDKPQGVGLGLATAQGIFKKHKGTVKLDSTSKDGSSFVCTMPLIEEVNGKK